MWKPARVVSVAPVILDQPTAACRPGKGSFHDPAPGQQDETALCLRQFDNVQRDAFGLGCCLAGVALIDIGKDPAPLDALSPS